MKNIVVYSAFKDMSFERDAFAHQIADLLNEEAAKHEDEVSFSQKCCGQDDSADTFARNLQVLRDSMNENNQQDLPVVVLLGECGDKVSKDDRHAFLMGLAKLKNTMRISRNVLFYYREVEWEDTEEGETLEYQYHQFKRKLLVRSGGRMRFYQMERQGKAAVPQSMDSFCEDVKNDLLQLLRKDWRRSDVNRELEQELPIHQDYYVQQAQRFLVREALAETYVQAAQKHRVTIIKGENGSGKSTLMGRLAEMMKQQGWDVLPIECGLTEHTTTAAGLIRLITHYLEREMELIPPEDGSEKWDFRRFRRMNDLCYHYIHLGRKLCIMIDAVDQLRADEVLRRLLFIPETLSGNLHVMMTCTPETETLSYSCIQLPPICQVEKHTLLEEMFRKLHRELSRDVEQAIIAKQCSDHPMYLLLMAHSLDLLVKKELAEQENVSDDTLLLHQLRKVEKCPDALEDMMVQYLSEVTDVLDDDWIERAGQFMAASRFGLRREALEKLTGRSWMELSFLGGINEIDDLFAVRADGSYAFRHRSIDRGFLKLCHDPAGIHAELLAFLKQQEDSHAGTRFYHAINCFDLDYITESLMSRREEDELALAEELYEAAQEDDGRLLQELFGFERLRRCRDENTDRLLCLVRFFNGMLYRYFMENGIESEQTFSAMERILSVSLGMIWERVQTLRDQREEELLLRQYANLGELYYQRARLTKNQKYYVNSMEMFHARKMQDPHWVEVLAEDYALMEEYLGDAERTLILKRLIRIKLELGYRDSSYLEDILTLEELLQSESFWEKKAEEEFFYEREWNIRTIEWKKNTAATEELLALVYQRAAKDLADTSGKSKINPEKAYREHLRSAMLKRSEAAWDTDDRENLVVLAELYGQAAQYRAQLDIYLQLLRSYGRTPLLIAETFRTYERLALKEPGVKLNYEQIQFLETYGNCLPVKEKGLLTTRARLMSRMVSKLIRSSKEEQQKYGDLQELSAKARAAIREAHEKEKMSYPSEYKTIVIFELKQALALGEKGYLSQVLQDLKELMRQYSLELGRGIDDAMLKEAAGLYQSSEQALLFSSDPELREQAADLFREYFHYSMLRFERTSNEQVKCDLLEEMMDMTYQLAEVFPSKAEPYGDSLCTLMKVSMTELGAGYESLFRENALLQLRTGSEKKKPKYEAFLKEYLRKREMKVRQQSDKDSGTSLKSKWSDELGEMYFHLGKIHESDGTPEGRLMAERCYELSVGYWKKTDVRKNQELYPMIRLAGLYLQYPGELYRQQSLKLCIEATELWISRFQRAVTEAITSTDAVYDLDDCFRVSNILKELIPLIKSYCSEETCREPLMEHLLPDKVMYMIYHVGLVRSFSYPVYEDQYREDYFPFWEKLYEEGEGIDRYLPEADTQEELCHLMTLLFQASEFYREMKAQRQTELAMQRYDQICRKLRTRYELVPSVMMVKCYLRSGDVMMEKDLVNQAVEHYGDALQIAGSEIRRDKVPQDERIWYLSLYLILSEKLLTLHHQQRINLTECIGQTQEGQIAFTEKCFQWLVEAMKDHNRCVQTDCKEQLYAYRSMARIHWRLCGEKGNRAAMDDCRQIYKLVIGCCEAVRQEAGKDWTNEHPAHQRSRYCVNYMLKFIHQVKEELFADDPKRNLELCELVLELDQKKVDYEEKIGEGYYSKDNMEQYPITLTNLREAAGAYTRLYPQKENPYLRTFLSEMRILHQPGWMLEAAQLLIETNQRHNREKAVAFCLRVRATDLYGTRHINTVLSECSILAAMYLKLSGQEDTYTEDVNTFLLRYIDFAHRVPRNRRTIKGLPGFRQIVGVFRDLVEEKRIGSRLTRVIGDSLQELLLCQGNAADKTAREILTEMRNKQNEVEET